MPSSYMYIIFIVSAAGNEAQQVIVNEKVLCQIKKNSQKRYKIIAVNTCMYICA